MRLADRFYFAAHDDATGRPRAHPRAIAYGLAAALLGELLHDRSVTIERGDIKLIEPTTHDALTTIVLHEMTIEPQHTAVPVWLEFLAQDSREQVARRLHRAGTVRREWSRSVIRRAAGYVPMDMNVAAWSWLDLVMKLDRGNRLDPTRRGPGQAGRHDRPRRLRPGRRAARDPRRDASPHRRRRSADCSRTPRPPSPPASSPTVPDRETSHS